MTENKIITILSVLDEVRDERFRQHAKWGEQNFPDGTCETHIPFMLKAKQAAEKAFDAGKLTFRHLLAEEAMEAFCEEDPAKLRAELIQVAAVAVQWIEAIDRRKK